MLTSRPFDASGAFCQTIDFGCTIMKIMIALKAFYEPKGCFVRYGTDRSGTIDILFTEEHFRIVMGFWLIFPREVQIDIGDFVAMETKEGFKRNIMAIFVQTGAAFWTFFLWHIITRTIRAVFIKLRILAIGTIIMRG